MGRNFVHLNFYVGIADFLFHDRTSAAFDIC